MTDTVPKEVRRKIMSSVGIKNTGPEIKVRSLLHRMGFRFRLHKKDLPGTPDIVLPKYKTAIFIHGCFWHQHPNCRYSRRPSSNTEYWNRKLKENIERDKKKAEELDALEWKVLIVWQCELKDESILSKKFRSFFPMEDSN